MIRFESVAKKYPDGTVAIHDLNLTAETGKITVLVGPSGCGKTTSLRMINRMIEPTSGAIYLDGQDTAGLPLTTLRRGIGYVIQHAGLFPHRTVLDNVTTVPMLLGHDKTKARARALELLELVGLDPRLAGRYPAQLSGGQQQRVGVARALAGDPPTMLMDEPFSAVDPIVRSQLQDEFLRLQETLDKTIVFVTHDIDEAIKLGDQVAVFREGGHLAQLAAPADLLAHPADHFVANFVGKDRGYRALGFAVAGDIVVDREPTVTLGATLDDARRATQGEWIVVRDSAGAPLGWLHLAGHSAAAGVDEVTDDLVELGSTNAPVRGSLREILDSTLSSPAGRGILVDDSGEYIGTTTTGEVLAAIARSERPAAPASTARGQA